MHTGKGRAPSHFACPFSSRLQQHRHIGCCLLRTLVLTLVGAFATLCLPTVLGGVLRPAQYTALGKLVLVTLPLGHAPALYLPTRLGAPSLGAAHLRQSAHALVLRDPPHWVGPMHNYAPPPWHALLGHCQHIRIAHLGAPSLGAA
jgi:hypothetical protein